MAFPATLARYPSPLCWNMFHGETRSPVGQADLRLVNDHLTCVSIPYFGLIVKLLHTHFQKYFSNSSSEVGRYALRITHYALHIRRRRRGGEPGRWRVPRGSRCFTVKQVGPAGGRWAGDGRAMGGPIMGGDRLWISGFFLPFP